jgi:hypothetical protein
MSQAQCGSVAPSPISISGSINTIEDQQVTIANMVTSIESVLYGSNNEKQANEAGGESMEIRLNNIVAANEKVMCKLERILTRM